MIQRHHDYQLSIPSVPAGGLFNVPLKLDSDAPFALRSVKTRNSDPASGFRFRTPRDQYQSPEFRTDLITNGQGDLLRSRGGVLIHPEMPYPVNGNIIVDIGNTTGAPLVNFRILFRGSKLFRDGSILSPTYPPTVSTLPNIYESRVLQVPVSGNSQAVPGLNCAAVLTNILNIRSDADFACRYLLADPFAMMVDGGPNPPPASFTEVYVRLYDESRKYFSNEPIHIADLFTVGDPSAGNVSNPPSRFFPGLLTPEIYLPKEGALYWDVYRDDAAFANQFPVDIYFRFQGAKVFAR